MDRLLIIVAFAAAAAGCGQGTPAVESRAGAAAFDLPAPLAIVRVDEDGPYPSRLIGAIEADEAMHDSGVFVLRDPPQVGRSRTKVWVKPPRIVGTSSIRAALPGFFERNPSLVPPDDRKIVFGTTFRGNGDGAVEHLIVVDTSAQLVVERVESASMGIQSQTRSPTIVTLELPPAQRQALLSMSREHRHESLVATQGDEVVATANLHEDVSDGGLVLFAPPLPDKSPVEARAVAYERITGRPASEANPQ